MKFTAIILFAACLHVSARSYSQSVTLSEKDATLEKVFSEIKKQTGYTFWYQEELLQDAKKVSVSVKNVQMQEVLQIIFKDQPLTYSIVEKTIVIKAMPSNADAQTILKDFFPPPPLDVHGRVVNEKGEPVEGVTVTIKERKVATATNSNGEFRLGSVESNAILIFTSTNMETFEVKVNGQTDLVINLKTKITDLQDIVINKGYYSISQKLNTGSVSKVTAETISKQPVSNPLAALEGRVSGLSIRQSSGLPGSAFTVQIRGQNSIINGNDPLYIIDGVPYTSTSLVLAGSAIINGGSPLNYINPADIESIEILKDADATAIYGSRGANGVILISLKKGNAGKTKVDINFYSGTGKVAKKMKLLDTPQYLQMRQEAFTNDGSSPGASDYDVNGTWDKNRYTDWQKVLIGGTAHMTNARVSISGGNTNTQFYIGGGYTRETSVFPTNFADQKGSLHFNLTNTSINRKFKVVLSGSYVVDNNGLPYSDMSSSALTLPPNAPSLYDPAGKLNWQNSTWVNPLASQQRKYYGNTDNLIGNTVLSYQVIPSLNLKVNLGFNKTQIKEKTSFPLSSFDPGSGTTSGSATFANSSITGWIIEPQAEYQTKFGKGNFTVLLGTTFQQNRGQSELLSATGYTSDDLLGSLKGASNISLFSNTSSKYNYNGVLGHINYDWEGKYLINLTARRDGSSRFGPGKQFTNFGAIGLGWIFSKEQFIKNNLPFISYGKLRTSYGTSGNDQIGDYGFLNLYNSTTYSYGGRQGLYPNNLYNADYAWEINRKFEVAVEFGFFKDRVLFTGSFYRSRSGNQLVGYPLASITGFTSIQANLPAVVQNTSWEFELNTTIIKAKNFTWSTGINFTVPNNKLLAYPDIETSSYNYYVVGKPLSIKKLYNYTGVNPNTGLYTVADINGDGNITYPQDLIDYNKVKQDFYGGNQHTFKYKNFQIDVFFQFVKRTERSYLGSTTFPIPGFLGNQPIEVLNRWQKPGDNTNIQRFTQTFGPAYSAYSNNALGTSNNSFTDASFIRLKNVEISWQFPSKWVQKIRMQNTRIYLQGQNLFTISKYVGLDPETLSFGLPVLKILTAGIQFTF